MNVYFYFLFNSVIILSKSNDHSVLNSRGIDQEIGDKQVLVTSTNCEKQENPFIEMTTGVSGVDKNTYSHLNENLELIPYLQRTQNNDLIIKNMDEFVLFRRKTHFKVPAFNESNNTIRNRDSIYEFHNDYFKKERRNYDYILEENETIDLLNDPQIQKILRKQKELIKKIEEQMKNEASVKNILRTDFEDLLQELENKPKQEKVDTNTCNNGTLDKDSYSNQMNITRRVKVTKEKLSTVMTLIDETKAREALKRDQYVRRILKMAKNKQREYLKAAKIFYNKNLA
ncbi:uncharacterized protein LOC128200085 [Galleria mellonella]|uniref:Uncharacterized protein LOC128200085 n=1 Tax=Galleria mellonella TaxID=7137 RepID=A0ABM3MAP7_GALME|nr:uncharacterized protein LOC128200085 [Galleria mellonella]